MKLCTMAHSSNSVHNTLTHVLNMIWNISTLSKVCSEVYIVPGVGLWTLFGQLYLIFSVYLTALDHGARGMNQYALHLVCSRGVALVGLHSLWQPSLSTAWPQSSRSFNHGKNWSNRAKSLNQSIKLLDWYQSNRTNLLHLQSVTKSVISWRLSNGVFCNSDINRIACKAKIKSSLMEWPPGFNPVMLPAHDTNSTMQYPICSKWRDDCTNCCWNTVFTHPQCFVDSVSVGRRWPRFSFIFPG